MPGRLWTALIVLLGRRLLWLCLFGYLALWAVIKPPFQAPDEFQHLIKAESLIRSPWVVSSPWVLIPTHRANPILEYRRLQQLPFHRNKTLHAVDVQAMKAIPWDSHETVAPYYTQAYSYPPLYYACVLAGQLAAQAAGLSPYDTTYWCRLVTAFLCAVVWSLVARGVGRLGMPSLKMVTAIVLLPMTGFISASISADGPLIAFASLSVVYALEVCIRDQRPTRLFGAMLIAGLIKPAVFILVPAITGGSAVIWLMKRQSSKTFMRSTATIVAAVSVCEIGFYFRSPPVLFGAPPPMTTVQYLNGVVHRAIPLFEAAVGFLGWTDYKLPHAYYAVTGILLMVNVGLWAYRRQFDTADVFMMSCAFLFVVGTFAGEYVLSSSELLQGRYFLPAGIGFAAVLRHRSAWCHAATFGWLALLNVLMLHMSVQRYYGGDYHLLAQALPFH